MDTFKNKIVLVTGASGGIGEAIAHDPNCGIPFLIGNDTDDPKILLFMCEVISSEPSAV